LCVFRAPLQLPFLSLRAYTATAGNKAGLKAAKIQSTGGELRIIQSKQKDSSGCRC
jgi:hypothetical protein